MWLSSARSAIRCSLLSPLVRSLVSVRSTIAASASTRAARSSRASRSSCAVCAARASRAACAACVARPAASVCAARAVSRPSRSAPRAARACASCCGCLGGEQSRSGRISMHPAEPLGRWVFWRCRPHRIFMWETQTYCGSFGSGGADTYK